MTRTTIERAERPAAGRLTRLAWFIGIWAASVAGLSGIAYLLHKIILG